MFHDRAFTALIGSMIGRLLLVMFLLPLSLSAFAESCLHYGGNPVALSGVIKLQTFFGPPNYGEDPNTDSRETQAIMILDTPICLAANPNGHEEAEIDQREVTLFSLGKVNLEKYVGKRVVIQGALHHASTAHHHTSVLFEVRRIKNAKKS